MHGPRQGCCATYVSAPSCCTFTSLKRYGYRPSCFYLIDSLVPLQLQTYEVETQSRLAAGDCGNKIYTQREHCIQHRGRGVSGSCVCLRDSTARPGSNSYSRLILSTYFNLCEVLGEGGYIVIGAAHSRIGQVHRKACYVDF